MDNLDIAVKMETDAIAFYTEASRKIGNPAGKKMFQAVAGDEKRHLEMIRTIMQGLAISHNEVSAVKNIKTVFESMKAEMMSRVEATKDELEAFKIAMEMEKEGMEFYKKLYAAAKKDKERAFLEQLIQEEQKHYDIFSNTYQFLFDTGNWFMWQELSIVEGG